MVANKHFEICIFVLIGFNPGLFAYNVPVVFVTIRRNCIIIERYRRIYKDDTVVDRRNF